jgi:hypothetical protein
MASAAGHCFGDEADAAVGGDYDVETAVPDRLTDRLQKVRVTVDVFDSRGYLRNLVRTTMENRDVIAAIQ